MARATDAERLKTWEDRLRAADKLYEKWSDKYEVKRLEDYYLGDQFRGYDDETAKKMYCINLVYASIEANRPTLSFSRPKVQMQARPERMRTLGSDAPKRALLCQDTVQTYIDDPDFNFDVETGLALHEAHFAFGVVEVGYSANWIDNPDAGKPVLKEDEKTPLTDSNGDVVAQGERIIENENVYLKRIPSKQFRVSISQKNVLSRNDFVAYFDWQYAEDIRRNPNYKNNATVKATGTITKDLASSIDTEDEEHRQRNGMCKVWKVWDIRAKKRYVTVEGHKKFLVDGEDFTYLPFAVIKFHEVLNKFYPFPPVYTWLGPQDEVNETREMQRAHRKRFYRRYTYMDGAIDEPELEKLENGGDGVYAKANVQDPLRPVPDAPLDQSNWTHLDRSQMDFMTVSAVGGEQRGVADSNTATQASIIDQRSRIRETAARQRVMDWLAQVARLILLTARDNLALPIMVKRSADPIAMMQDPRTSELATLWQEIQSEELENIDLDITIDLASMSPVAQEMERQSWNQVLVLLANPGLSMILSQSDVLLRKTLNLYGITNETEIQEIKKVMMQQLQQQQMMALAGAKPGGASPGVASIAGVGGKQPGAGQGGQTLEGDNLAATIGAATQGGSVQ